MQQQHIKLREIIWEITGECKNGCTYCGSKSVRNTKTDNETILKIAKAIAEYPPEEINISGGDPLLLSISMHEEILKIFKEKNIVCKILVNPNSLGDSSNSATFEILKKYDWTGISVNTSSELEKIKELLNPKFVSPDVLVVETETPTQREKFENYTVITNFNIQNLYIFDSIEEFVKKNNKMWTIQFTVYDDPNNPLALYHPDNEAAFNVLKEKVEKSGARIILSDNIRNDMPCGAGISSLGITYDGKVIPCLSMRSWTKDFGELINILITPLEQIWINSFKEQRFGIFKCCKDACDNKCLQQKTDIFAGREFIEIPIEKEKDWKKFIEEIVKENPRPQIQDYAVVMYAVVSPQIIMYGVDFPRQPNILLYGVKDNFNRVYVYGVFYDKYTTGDAPEKKDDTTNSDTSEIK